MPQYYNNTGFGDNTGKLPNNPIPMTPQQAESNSAIQQMIDGRDNLSTAGVQVNFHSLNGQKLRFHHITIPVSEPGKRIAVEVLAKQECDRIVGVTVCSSEPISSHFESNLAYSTMGLNIDNEEILPDDMACHLIMAKMNCGFYDNMYRFNERANSSQIKINYEASATKWVKPYIAHVFLWCTSSRTK